MFAGVRMYNLISYFIFFSFIGWVWESIYVSVMEHRIVNRGYVTGPCCTIYGVGGIFMTLTLRPFKDNLVMLFLLAIVFTTTLEYVTAVVMEKLFHTSWWDYTMERFNYKGRISLKSSLAWGFASLFLFNVLIPFVDGILKLYPERYGKVAIRVIAVVYVIDFVFATIAAVDVSKQIAKLDQMLDELEAYFRSTRLYSEGEELKNRLGAIRLRITEINYIQRYSKRLEVAQAVWKDRITKVGSKYTSETLSRVRDMYQKVMIGRTWNSLLQLRILRAYPKITSGRHFRELQHEAEMIMHHDRHSDKDTDVSDKDHK
jgi:uncharacterized membrane protein